MRKKIYSREKDYTNRIDSYNKMNEELSTVVQPKDLYFTRCF